MIYLTTLFRKYNLFFRIFVRSFRIDMKNFFTYVSAVLAVLLAVSCHTKENEPAPEPEPPAPEPILSVTAPGLYGIGGDDYVLGEGGWNQASFLTGVDGSVRWRLLNAGTLSAVTLTGIRADDETGKKYTLHINLSTKGVPSLTVNCQATLLDAQNGTWWYKVGDNTYFVVKKEVAL